MKLGFATIFACLTLLTISLAQETEIRNQAGKARIDLAVPDAPAMKLLEVDPSTILRPSTMREIGLALKDFALGGGALPKAVAMELAPYKLIRGENISLQKYREDRFWYQTRISIGAKAASNGPSDLSIGLRFSILDETDLRANEELADKLVEYASWISEAVVSYKKSTWYHDIGKAYFESLPESSASKDSIRKSIQMKTESLGPATQSKVDSARRANEHNAFVGLGRMRYADVQSDSTLRAEYDALLIGPETPAGKIRQQADREIVRVRDAFKIQHWNGTVFEISVAALASVGDSIAKNLVDSKYGIWSMYALPVWGDKGQMILGANGTAQRDTARNLNQFQGSIAARVYGGTNEYKGFLEFSIAGRTTTHPSWALSLGGELNVSNGIWVEASIAYDRMSDGKTTIRNSFNVRMATPETRF